MLATVGHTEATALDLTLCEVTDLLRACERREAREQARAIGAAYYGAAAGVNGGETAEAVQDLLDRLADQSRAPGDEPAGPDLDALNELVADPMSSVSRVEVLA